MKARRRRVRPFFHRTPCLMAALLACAWPAQGARAHDPRGRGDATADANTRDVVLDVASPERFDAESEATVRELLARLGLRLVRSEPPAHATIVAYVRVQAAGRGALVIVSDGRGRVGPVRREVPPAATRTLFRETLAHVILGAVEPLAAGEPTAPSGATRSPGTGSPTGAPDSGTKGAAGARATSTTAATGATSGSGTASPAPTSDSSSVSGVSPSGAAASPTPPARSVTADASAPTNEQQPESSAAAPDALHVDTERAPAQRSPTAWALSIGARGAGVVLASERVSARFGGAAALVFPTRFAPAFALDTAYTLPVHIVNGGVGADFSLVSLRGYARVEPYRRARWALRTALGGGVDVVSMEPTSGAPGLLLMERTRRAHPMLGPALSVRFGSSARFAFIFDLGFDLDCGPATWTVPREDRGEERTAKFFEPARVRPYATLGIDWNWSHARSGAGAEVP